MNFIILIHKIHKIQKMQSLFTFLLLFNHYYFCVVDVVVDVVAPVAVVAVAIAIASTKKGTEVGSYSPRQLTLLRPSPLLLLLLFLL